jgi:hypothetical protein
VNNSYCSHTTNRRLTLCSLLSSLPGLDVSEKVGITGLTLTQDVNVGYGRRNPNAQKGRERRGAKKAKNKLHI